MTASNLTITKKKIQTRTIDECQASRSPNMRAKNGLMDGKGLAKNCNADGKRLTHLYHKKEEVI